MSDPAYGRRPGPRAALSLLPLLALLCMPSVQPWPKREPDEHGPDEDCGGLCGAQACIDKSLAKLWSEAR